MKASWQAKVSLIREVIAGKLAPHEAARRLGVTQRTIRNHQAAFLRLGPEGLRDSRGGNHRKLTPAQEATIKKLKRQGPWRSARFIRDQLQLKVDQSTVRRVIVKAGLNRLNAKRLKPITRFVAPYPNALWQTDIMGRIDFPFIGIAYLIATIDDHSRALLSSRWAAKQSKVFVLGCWLGGLKRWGIPEAMLQDRGGQYHAGGKGETDYQYYAAQLEIKLVWANHARTKGKIERFFRFIQQDFVRENLGVRSFEELNSRWRLWMARYNYTWKSRARDLKGRTPMEAYRPSRRRYPSSELNQLVSVEERRKVRRDSTISLYGYIYPVPRGYIGCRIWVRVTPPWIKLIANDQVFWKMRLKSFTN
jgi:putative transposase